MREEILNELEKYIECAVPDLKRQSNFDDTTINYSYENQQYIRINKDQGYISLGYAHFAEDEEDKRVKLFPNEETWDVTPMYYYAKDIPKIKYIILSLGEKIKEYKILIKKQDMLKDFSM